MQKLTWMWFMIKWYVFILTSLFYSLAAFGWSSETSDEKWRSGWGQGVAEAQITHGSGNQIYIACEDGSGRPSSISFMLAGDGPKNTNEIMLIFDKDSPETARVGEFGMITSDSYASDSTFRDLIAKFKKHKKVYIRFPNGRESTFTLNGAAKTIGKCRSTYP